MEEDIDEEAKHMHDVLKSFSRYYQKTIESISLKWKSYDDLSKEHKMLLDGKLNERLTKTEEAISVNQNLIDSIIEFAKGMFVNREYDLSDSNDPNTPAETFNDYSKVRTAISQLVRDWSHEGANERSHCYGYILNWVDSKLEDLIPNLHRSSFKVLIPGVGLGRLLFEFANRGFECEGNDYSLHMLIVSNFMLNSFSKPESIKFYPWITQSCNNMCTDDYLRPVIIPDVSVSCENENELNMRMTAGDFLTVYEKGESWNMIVTCYFIDTHCNILEVIDRIFLVLKKGGIWINFGPLLYHFADSPEYMSIELTYEELREIIFKKHSFTLIHEQTGIRSEYMQNPQSMCQNYYNCVFFVAQKI